jgi:hypothetical protein
VKTNEGVDFVSVGGECEARGDQAMQETRRGEARRVGFVVHIVYTSPPPSTPSRAHLKRACRGRRRFGQPSCLIRHLACPS